MVNIVRGLAADKIDKTSNIHHTQRLWRMCSEQQRIASLGSILSATPLVIVTRMTDPDKRTPGNVLGIDKLVGL